MNYYFVIDTSVLCSKQRSRGRVSNYSNIAVPQVPVSSAQKSNLAWQTSCKAFLVAIPIFPKTGPFTSLFCVHFPLITCQDVTCFHVEQQVNVKDADLYLVVPRVSELSVALILHGMLKSVLLCRRAGSQCVKEGQIPQPNSAHTRKQFCSIPENSSSEAVQGVQCSSSQCLH